MSATQLERVLTNQAHPGSWPLLHSDPDLPVVRTDAEQRAAYADVVDAQRTNNP